MTCSSKLAGALLFLGSLVPAQDARVAWLNAHAAPIASLALDDLGAVEQLVGDARIVMLGEAGHGDGATFRIKVAICKLLHERMGFSVVVFESGLYDCAKAWQRIAKGEDAHRVAKDSVFSIWSNSREVAPLWTYLNERRGTKKPLELAGFDMQPTGSASRKQLFGEIRQAVEGIDEALLAGNDWRAFAAPYELMRDGKGREVMKLGESSQKAFLEASRKVVSLLEGGGQAFLAQCLRSSSTCLDFYWNADFRNPDPDVMNRRDAQMAENLQWLLRERYQGRRIIVWGATSHLIRNRQSITTEIAPKMIPMGHHLHQSMANDIVTLGFLAGGGRRGVARDGAPRHDVEAPPAGSLDQFLVATKFDHALLDLRAPAAGGEFLRERLVARPLGYAPMAADWSQVLDAIWFVRTMTPSEVVESR